MKYALNRMKLLLIASGIVFIALIFTVVRLFGNTNSNNTNTQNQGTITPSIQTLHAGLVVDFGNGKTASYDSVELNEGETVYSLLVRKMNETGSPVTTKSYNFGIMVESINNITGNSDYFWGYSVNGQMGQVAADKYVLKDKDAVEWKFEKTQ